MRDTKMQLNINTWKSVSGNVTFWLLCHQFPHMHFMLWHSIMACVFYNTNKHEFNRLCYDLNCFNFISVFWIILCANLTHFVFTSKCLPVYRYQHKQPLITEHVMQRNCCIKNWHKA